jgi:hypothetical protein
MRHKNAFWISLICGTAFSFTPMSVHAASQDVVPSTGPPKSSMQQPSSPPKSRDEWGMQHTVSGPYRLTYTLTEIDGGKRIGLQHYVIVLDADSDAPPTNLRLGTKVPIATSQAYGNVPNQQQLSYVDIGLSIDARLRQFANGFELRTKVYQTSLDAEKSDTKDPVIRQSTLESSVLLNEDKPVVLGTLDTPESTHRLQIQVELAKLP